MATAPGLIRYFVSTASHHIRITRSLSQHDTNSEARTVRSPLALLSLSTIVLLVLSSEYYDAGDYIRTYGEFKALIDSVS